MLNIDPATEGTQMDSDTWETGTVVSGEECCTAIAYDIGWEGATVMDIKQ